MKLLKRKSITGAEFLVNAFLHNVDKNQDRFGKDSLTDYFSAESLADVPMAQSAMGSVFEEVEESFQMALDNEKQFGEASFESADPNSPQNLKPEYTPAQKKAAAEVRLAFSDPSKWLSEAISPESFTDQNDIVGEGGTIEAADMYYSPEEYDTNELKATLGVSMGVNFQLARQTPFAEAAFKTITIGTNQAGVEMTAEYPVAFRDSARDVNGAPLDLQQRILLDAIGDATVLDDTSTDLVPVLKPETKKYFAPEAEWPAFTQKVGSEEAVKTGWLKPSMGMDFIGLSQNANRLKVGEADFTDQISSGGRVSKLGLGFASADGKTIDRIPFDISEVAGNNFLRSQTGDGRDVLLNIPTLHLTVGPNTKDINGDALSVLKPLTDAGYKLVVRLGISANVNLRNGQMQGLMPSSLSIVELRDANGEVVSGSDPVYNQIAVIVERSGVEAVVWGLKLTNSNAATRYQLLDTRSYRYNVIPRLRAPFVTTKPIVGSDGNMGAGANTLLQGQHARCSNDAHTTMLNAIQTMRAAVGGPIEAAKGVALEKDSPVVDGIGRVYCNPYFLERDIDLSSLNSLTSTERRKDISSELVNNFYAGIIDMYTKSEYQIGFDALVGGNGGRPHIGIFTSVEIANYLMISGDPRTFGPMLDFSIYASYDHRWRELLFGTFIAPERDAMFPMSFGMHVWKAQVIAQSNINRRGRTNDEHWMQRCNIHHVKLPTMCVFHVKGLPDSLTEQTSINVNTHSVDKVPAGDDADADTGNTPVAPKAPIIGGNQTTKAK